MNEDTSNLMQIMHTQKSEAEQQFASATSWETRFRTLMLLGKTLPTLSPELQTEANRVHGCESKVWLAVENRGSHFYFKLGSDAKIVRGLLCLLFLNIEGQDAKFIQQFDFSAYLSKLKILGQLSESRTNGLKAIIETINQQVATL